jgi:hypothetical protein
MDFSRELPEVKSGSGKKRACRATARGPDWSRGVPAPYRCPFFPFGAPLMGITVTGHSIGEEKLYSN